MRHALWFVALAFVVSTTLWAADQTNELPPARQRDLRKLAGTRPPPPARLKLQIQLQHARAQKISAVLKRVGAAAPGAAPASQPEAAPPRQPEAAPAPGPDATPIPPLNDLPRKFDWNDHNAVTDIKDQGDCGSCWAFATTAALESNYLIPGHSGNRVNASEKSVLDCVPSYDCTGGWWDEPFYLMMFKGIADEQGYPYPANPAKGPCQMDVDPNAQPKYKILNWDYVDADLNTFIPTNDAMKKALVEHGPIVIAFNATQNFVHWDFATTPVFKENDTGEPNHAMLLVGWDDDKEGGAWHIKNSWRADWGDHGFAWVGYGTNSVGYGAAWVETTLAPTTPQPDQDAFNNALNEVQREVKAEREAATRPGASPNP